MNHKEQKENKPKTTQENPQNSKKNQVRAVFSLGQRSSGRLNLNRQLRERQINQKSGQTPSFTQEKRRGRQRPGIHVSSEFEEKLIKLARVVKVVKGGRRFSFTAYVVVGNKKGKIGLGHGNANEVQDAIKKAVKDGIKNIIEVPIVKSSVPHEVVTKFLATRVLIKPAPIGRGLVAAGVARTVVELAGYVNITTKIYGSRSPQNVALAMLKALSQMKTKKQIQFLRFGPREQQRNPQRATK